LDTPASSAAWHTARSSGLSPACGQAERRGSWTRARPESRFHTWSPRRPAPWSEEGPVGASCLPWMRAASPSPLHRPAALSSWHSGVAPGRTARTSWHLVARPGRGIRVTACRGGHRTPRSARGARWRTAPRRAASAAPLLDFPGLPPMQTPNASGRYPGKHILLRRHGRFPRLRAMFVRPASGGLLCAVLATVWTQQHVRRNALTSSTVTFVLWSIDQLETS
jgi:hypothetical protein